MIALNEIIKNREVYERKYRIKGCKVDFEKIFSLTNIMKDLQLATEALRADCNKLCGSVADYRNQNKDVKIVVREIKKIDKTIDFNTKKLFKINKNINLLLKSLDNLPVHENMNDEVLCSNDNQELTQKTIEAFVESLEKVEIVDYDIDKQMQYMQNMILDNPNQIYKCKNGYLFVTSHDRFDLLQKSLIEFFKDNASKLIRKGVADLSKQSSDSYVAEFSTNSTLLIEIIDEFLSREYKIKYHDDKIDMTKFVKQINLYFD